MEELIKKIKNNEVILFVGAGVSATLNLPTWSQLVDYLAETLGFDSSIFKLYGDNLMLAEYYKLEKGSIGYVLNNLLGQRDFPHMTPQLQKKIAESIYEMFINAQMHSNTDYIYTCGQFSPAKHTIDFTVVDMGIGFKRKIEDRFDKSISAGNAIKWATQDGHSTKIDISGGLGLAILKDFVIMNKGKIQIVSDDVFFQLSELGEETKVFTNSFPGTVINMQFRTDDENSYCLNSEIDLSNIF